MSFSLILAGIFTGTLAAIYAMSLDSGVVWAMVSYAASGTLALLGAGVITAIRRNYWPHSKRGYASRSIAWKQRLDTMAHQASEPAQVGPFQGS
ncbi:hypothetical protein [Aliiroseovarius sp. 2305UL8-7]|uniref:hypothetical protein n=1 Tax=Aliiroseovarius conchicola TaxID=3121637 RepID=UPI003527385C